MSTFQYFFNKLRRNRRIAEIDAYLLERRVKEICNWRLNFYVGDAQQRFLQIAEDIAERLLHEVRLKNIALEHIPSVEGFTNQIKGIMDNWGNTQPIVLYAGA
jgi:hypothetical protein